MTVINKSLTFGKTKHWREIFNPAAQIFLKSTAIYTKGYYYGNKD